MRIPTFSQFQHEADMISVQFDKMSQLQQQAVSGKKIINSSDDPVLANEIQSTQTFIDVLQTYKLDGDLASGRYSLFENSAHNALTSLGDIQQQIQKAQNGTYSTGDLKSIAVELQGNLNTLLNVANMQDMRGQYIYAGSNSNFPAYVNTSSGYQYQGGYDATLVNIGQNITTTFNESGANIFGNILQGNGTFTVTAGSGNTGQASTSTGSAANDGSYVPDIYMLSVAYNANTPPQLVYSVTGASSGQIIPAPPATIPAGAPVWSPDANGMNINFNGISINVMGTPNAGDNFQIQPSAATNVFDELQGLINVLQDPESLSKGNLAQALSQASATFGQIHSHFNTYLSDVGTRAAAVTNQEQVNKDFMDRQTIALSGLQDVNATEVFSALMQQSLALQVAQAGYLKMQDTLSQLLKI